MNATHTPTPKLVRRMLLVAVVVMLCVVVSVVWRSRDGARGGRGSEVTNVGGATSTAVTKVMPTDSGTTQPQELPAPEGAAIAAANKVSGPITLTYDLSMFGGCQPAPGDRIEFAQLGLKSVVLKSEMRAFTGSTRTIEFPVEWMDEATAFVIAPRFAEAVAPPLYFKREMLDELAAGSHSILPISPSSQVEVFNVFNDDPAYRINCAKIEAAMIHTDTSATPEANGARTLALYAEGGCPAEIIVELPAGVEMSSIEDLELYFDPEILPGNESKMSGQSNDIHFGLLVRGTPEPKFHRLQHEIKIRPIMAGAYGVFLRTSEGYWYSEKLFLKPGESRRLHPELQLGATIIARVKGAAGPDEGITYKLGGFWRPIGLRAYAREHFERSSVPALMPETIRGGRADSEIRFGGLPESAYTITASDSLEGMDSVQFELGAEEVREVTLSLKKAIPVQVEVVDESGVPIPDADVVAAPEIGREFVYGNDLPDGKTTLELRPGRWHFEATDTNGASRAESDATIVASGIGDHIRIILSTHYKVRGRVLNMKGAQTRRLDLVATSTVPGSGVASAERVDDDGAFEFSLPVGEFNLGVQSPFFGSVRRFNVPMPAGEELLISLSEGFVSGRILDAQTREPIGGVAIQLRTAPENLNMGTLINAGTEFRYGLCVRTDGAGHFSAPEPMPGMYLLTVVAPGYAGIDVPLNIPASDVGDIYLDVESASIRGQVTDPKQRPVWGLRLRSLEDDSGIVYLGRDHVCSNSQGYYLFENLPVGTFRATFTPVIAGMTRPLQNHVVDGLKLEVGETLEYNFTVDFAARVKLFVTDQNDVPLSMVALSVYRDGVLLPDSEAGAGGAPPRTDGIGKCVLDSLVPGAYRIEATAPDGKRGAAEALLGDGETAYIDIRVE